MSFGLVRAGLQYATVASAAVAMKRACIVRDGVMENVLVFSVGSRIFHHYNQKAFIHILRASRSDKFKTVEGVTTCRWSGVVRGDSKRDTPWIGNHITPPQHIAGLAKERIPHSQGWNVSAIHNSYCLTLRATLRNFQDRSITNCLSICVPQRLIA